MRAAFVLPLLLACSDPGAALDIDDARATRLPDRRVAVDVELLAREGLGGNAGTYCVRVTFPAQTDPAQECASDLEDGDARVIRFTSDGDLEPGASITIRVRLGALERGRVLAAPPR